MWNCGLTLLEGMVKCWPNNPLLLKLHKVKHDEPSQCKTNIQGRGNNNNKLFEIYLDGTTQYMSLEEAGSRLQVIVRSSKQMVYSRKPSRQSMCRK